jgi:HAD superfamily hydrolase (TIGR01509 family)
MKNEKLLIFDCDGVLVDSETLSVKTIVQILEKLSIKAKEEEIAFFFKGAKLDLIFNDIARHFCIKLERDFQEHFHSLFEEKLNSELKAISGIAEILDTISQPKCVASSAPRDKIIKVLKKTGLSNYFGDFLYSSFDINSWKPDPDIFLYAASSMGFHPSDCIVIEDTLAGVQAAKRAGMTVLGFSPSHFNQELVDNGAIVFSDMRQLPKMIINS